LIALSVVLGFEIRARSDEPGAPAIVCPIPTNEPSLVTYADGSIKLFLTFEGKHVASMLSKDNGLTWMTQRVEFPAPEHADFTARAMVDSRGETHVCFLVGRGVGNRKLGVDLFYDVWYSRTLDRGGRWTEPRPIFKGYVGALRGFTELKNGRLVLAFAEWIGGRLTKPPTGANETVVCYSDDHGESWTQSKSRLTCPSPEGENGVGGVEPTVLQLNSGRVWMLIRTEAGSLFESFSDDNAVTWSPAQPSRFASSESPACLLRLKDGGILLIWNNCTPTPDINGMQVYSGRDALHAAISRDEGKSWSGFREIYRDPTRHRSPPKSGDRGTAYPSATEAADGSIVVATGQGEEPRCIVRFHPKWLEADSSSTDPSSGIEEWTCFKSIGPVERYWRARAIGPELVARESETSKALHLRRTDNEAPDGANWNFPLGRKGKLTVRLLIPSDSKGGVIALTDRFFEPSDATIDKEALAILRVSSDERTEATLHCKPESWHQLQLSWDMDHQTYEAQLNDDPAIPVKQIIGSPNGACYLNLRSSAEMIDLKGIHISSVEVKIERRSGLSIELGPRN
jgi:hypothetical protein